MTVFSLFARSLVSQGTSLSASGPDHIYFKDVDSSVPVGTK